MAYRDAAAKVRPTAAVHYRPMHPLLVLLLVLVVLSMATLTLFQALGYIRSVELECVRGGVHTCTVQRHYGPITTHEAVPIMKVHSVNVGAHSYKNGTSYSVNLFLKNGDLVQVMSPSKRIHADARRLEVEKLVFDPTPGTARLAVQASSPWTGTILTLLALGLAAMSLMFTRSGRVELDFHRGTVTHTLFRWPLSAKRQVFRAADVRRAEITTHRGNKGGITYGVALDMAHGPRVGIAGDNGGGSEKRARHKALELNALLAKLHDEHPPA